MRRALQTLACSTMEGRAAMRKVLLGQRLSAQAVSDVARGIARTEVDPAAVENISRGFPSGYKLLPPPPDYATLVPDLLLESESKAALFVALHKLLQGSAPVRKNLPIFLCEVLNDAGSRIQLQNSDQPLLDVARFLYHPQEFDTEGTLQRRLAEIGVSEFPIGVAEQELEALNLSTRDSMLLGIAAMSVHLASDFNMVADVVASLSCEALRAKVTAFDDKVYRQDSTHSSVADAAKTLKSLLQNSKMVNFRKGLDAEFIASIPEVHGAFKESLKVVSAVLRVEINRTYGSGEKMTSWPSPSSVSTMPQVNFLLEDALKSLISCLSRLVSYSSKRTTEVLKLLTEPNSLSSLPWLAKLLNKWTVIDHFDQTDKTKLLVSRRAFSLVQEAVDAIALEAALALRLLSLREADSKNLKAPRDLGLGRGTSLTRKALVDIIGGAPTAEGEADDLHNSFSQLRAFFTPRDDGLQKFIEEVKVLIESSEARRLPQVPKGTRDFGPEQMAIRERAFNIITKVFKLHGGVSLDTPVFELKETLMGKYGEDSKLIYDLADQGGQMLSLRYDLTVPFARYLATNNLTSMKRYHIAKVYRRDNPSAGRYREFYQCDFDIAGQFPTMVADAEVINVITDLLDALDIGSYEVKLNHRKLLDGMLAICGVPENKFRTICSAIDKLDKTPWEKVRNEMVNEKGLAAEVADRIGVHVARRGEPMMVLDELKKQQEYLNHEGSSKALEELTTLFRYLEASKCINRVVFDMSLARGLDYYTGVIYEAVFKGTIQVGSIAAGGRYDKLVGMFSSKEVPAVGVSLGIERVFLLMEQQEKERGNVVRTKETQVLIYFLGSSMMDKAFGLARQLWDELISTEFDAFSPTKLTNKLLTADKSGVPYVVIMGEDEERRGKVKLRIMANRDEKEIERETLIPKLKELVHGATQ